MNRKDDHIRFALEQDVISNDFDKMNFIHHGLQKISFDEIDLSTSFSGFNYNFPIYINAMTGGSDQAKSINDKLSLIANHFSIAMATGSASIVIKNPDMADSFSIVRNNLPDGIVMANIGADKKIEDAQYAISLLNADILQIHINQVQEMIMPEGERDFTNWHDNIKRIIENISVPIIIKEVGYGMNVRTIKLLKSFGAKTIDISGKGGTNFSIIENNRRDISMNYLNSWGLSTVQSLLEASLVKDVEILASGGIRNPLDVVKALSLGAKAVGLSSYFLKLVVNNTIEDSIKNIEQFLDEIKVIMTLLGARNIEELKHTELIFNQDIINYINQRNINISILNSR